MRQRVARRPDAPTLCAGWDVRDLLVHLAVRDNRPDVALGEALPPLRSHRDKVVSELASQPFDALVERVRNGPHGPLRVRALDGLVNSAEYFVHHEDVLRAQPGGAPASCPQAQEERCGAPCGSWAASPTAAPPWASCW